MIRFSPSKQRYKKSSQFFRCCSSNMNLKLLIWVLLGLKIGFSRKYLEIQEYLMIWGVIFDFLENDIFSISFIYSYNFGGFACGLSFEYTIKHFYGKKTLLKSARGLIIVLLFSYRKYVLSKALDQLIIFYSEILWEKTFKNFLISLLSKFYTDSTAKNECPMIKMVLFDKT